MPYDRIHNFAAGPAVLPVPVVEKVRDALPNLEGTGIGLMEISHRSKTFDAVVRSAQQRLRRVMSIPDTHEVLFLQGGASLQFLMVPMNLMGSQGKADYVNTGVWSKKAIKEASLVGDCRVAWTGEELGFKRVPRPDEVEARPDAAYLHYTTNNTIYGTAFFEAPQADIPLVADMSSDIAAHPVDVARHAVIYAGAQKNMGPSGVTVVVVDKTCLGKVADKLPTYLDYNTHIAKDTLFNTPCTLGIFVVEAVLEWLEGLGGIEAMRAMNESKAGLLYGELDRTDFWRPHAEVDSRSWMNVTWRIANTELEPVFLEEALQEGLSGLKGHRSVGGLRASIYNACPREAVEALVGFMRDFEKRHG